MVVSQNGWPANDRSLVASYSVPGGKVSLRKGDASVVLIWWLEQWHTRVEALRWPGIWGYAERTIRGSSTTLSNHASATAVDANAPAHPLGVDPTKSFSQAQIDEIHKIIAESDPDGSGPVLRWGGDYSGRKDGMHGEIIRGTAAVKALADKIRAAAATAAAAPAPAPRPAASPAGGGIRKPDALPVLATGATGGWVGLMQQCVGLSGSDVDEDFGDGSEAALIAHQRRVFTDPKLWDGICGPMTWVSFIYLAGDPLVAGAKGHPGIEVLQNMLGFRGADLDRDFGSGTEGRVKDVQRWGGVDPDGEVGENTRRVLERA